MEHYLIMIRYTLLLKELMHNSLISLREKEKLLLSTQKERLTFLLHISTKLVQMNLIWCMKF